MSARMWVVVVVAAPLHDPKPVGDLGQELMDAGARRIGDGVFVVPHAAETARRLEALADPVRAAGGRVLVADAHVVEAGYGDRARAG